MTSFSLDELDVERGEHIAMARTATVQIRAGQNGHGAGTIIHRDGLIVTNAHVVRGFVPHVLLANGNYLRGELLAYDERIDLAAVSVNCGPLRALTLGNSHRLRPGSLVVAVGNPWGVVGAATAGMVISVGHPVETLPYDGELIQVGMQLRPGHSGGPLLDDNGNVVGINTMIAGPHVGLAIPAVTVARFLQDRLGSRSDRSRAQKPVPIPS